MGKKGHFKQKRKLDILVNAKEIGIKKAADLAGIHYTTGNFSISPREIIGFLEWGLGVS
ncbi:MAG: hypothetical protein V3W43_03545 [Desulfatiglandaceae bacterium]